MKREEIIKKFFKYTCKNVGELTNKESRTYKSFIKKFDSIKSIITIEELLLLNKTIYLANDMNNKIIYLEIINRLNEIEDKQLLIDNAQYFNPHLLFDNSMKIANPTHTNLFEAIGDKNIVYEMLLAMPSNRKLIKRLEENEIRNLKLHPEEYNPFFLYRLSFFPHTDNPKIYNEILKAGKPAINKVIEGILNDKECSYDALEEFVLFMKKADYIHLFYHEGLAMKQEAIIEKLKEYDLESLINYTGKYVSSIETIRDIENLLIKTKDPKLMLNMARRVRYSNINKIFEALLKGNNAKELYLWPTYVRVDEMDRIINALVRLKEFEKISKLTKTFKNIKIEKAIDLVMEIGDAKDVYNFALNCSKEYLKVFEKKLKTYEDDTYLREFYARTRNNKNLGIYKR